MNKFLILLLLVIVAASCGGGKGPGKQGGLISPVTRKATYNIYVENSASMDGYVNGASEFKTTVYNYLSDIKIADFTDSLNLNYINSKEIHQGSDIADFIEKLDPTAFKEGGGDKGISDIADVLKMVIKGATKNNVSIVISDFIFSPGKGKDADEYLVNQQIGIKTIMAEHLKQYPNHSVLIYQLDSKFDGSYFNRLDKPTHFVGTRPYYICIIGDSELLSNLMKKCPVEKFKGGGVKNFFSVTKKGRPLNYAVQYGSGNFKPDRKGPHHSIIKAQKDERGIGEKKLRFNLNADLSNLLLDDSYLLAADNYDISDKDYQLVIQKSKVAEGYTHLLKLSTSIVKPSIISIKIKSKVPQWVKDITDSTGLNVKQAPIKTYGFSYLVNGIYEAFTTDGDYCAEMIIKVNQN